MSLTSLGADEIARRLFRYDRCRAALTDKAQFGAGSLDQFRQDGFVAIEGLLSPSEIATATAALSFLIAGGNPAYAGVSLEDVAQGDRPGPADREPYVRKLLGFVDFEPRLALLAHHPSVLEVVERILGGPVRLVQDMALLKPAHIGREKPWHQDAAYFPLDPPDSVLGVWIALDAATPGNGCMHVIPGTHRAGPQPHYHDRDCQLPDEEVAVDRDVMVPLRLAECSFSARYCTMQRPRIDRQQGVGPYNFTTRRDLPALSMRRPMPDFSMTVRDTPPARWPTPAFPRGRLPTATDLAGLTAHGASFPL